MEQVAFFLEPMRLPDDEACIYRECRREMCNLPLNSASISILVPPHMSEQKEPRERLIVMYADTELRTKKVFL